MPIPGQYVDVVAESAALRAALDAMREEVRLLRVDLDALRDPGPRIAAGLRKAVPDILAAAVASSRVADARGQLTESARAEIVGWLLAGGVTLKRDNDLLRRIMFEIEAQDDPIYEFGTAKDETREARLRYFHLRLLVDAGFLEETGQHGGCFRMTNQGHDFLALVRKDTFWEQVKETAASLPGAGIAIIRDVAVSLIRQEMVNRGLL